MQIKNIGKESIHNICSSQVIFTLSSVVKELVENSIDADANEIKIKLVESGNKLIEVNDNGKGIKKINFENVCARHATSKISEFNDIQNSLNTLGFRGEALNSLCILSDISITTKNDESEHGYLLKFDRFGNLVHEEPIARLRGTTVSCENIFKHVPIRKKDFIKNIKTQLSQLLILMQQYAIIYHNIKFSICNIVTVKGCTKNINLLMTNGSDNLINNFYSIFGKRNIGNLIEFNIDTDEWKVRGLVSDNSSGRKDKDLQFYYMNSRPIHILKNVNKIINTIYREFNSRLYPIIVINILSDTKNVDINVTPDKREVFFTFENEMCEEIKTSLVKLLTPKTNNLIDTQIGDYFLKANNLLGKNNNLKIENDHEKDFYNLNEKNNLTENINNENYNDICIKKERDNTTSYSYENNSNENNIYDNKNILEISDNNGMKISSRNYDYNDKNYTNKESHGNSNNNNNNNSNSSFKNSENSYKNKMNSKNKNIYEQTIGCNMNTNINEYNYHTFVEKEEKKTFKNYDCNALKDEDYCNVSRNINEKEYINNKNGIYSYDSDNIHIKNINKFNEKTVDKYISNAHIDNDINMMKTEYKLKNEENGNDNIYEYKLDNYENEKKAYEYKLKNEENESNAYEYKLKNEENGNDNIYEYKLDNYENEKKAYEYKLKNEENEDNAYEYKLKNEENESNAYEYKLKNEENEDNAYEYKLKNEENESNDYEYKLKNEENGNDNIYEYKLDNYENEKKAYEYKLKNDENNSNISSLHKYKMENIEIEQNNSLSNDCVDYSFDDLKKNIKDSCIKNIPIDINMYINRETLKMGYDYDQIHVINLTNSEKIKNIVFHKVKYESKLNNYLCLTDDKDESNYKNLFNSSLNIKESSSTSNNSINSSSDDIDFNNIDENKKDLYFKSNLFNKLKICGQFNRGFIISKIDLLYFKDQSNQEENKNFFESYSNRKNEYALFIIDQHAADEKSNFEKYNKIFSMKSQKLINKINLQLSPAQIHIIQKNLEIFLENGFEVEIAEEPIHKKRKLNDNKEEIEINKSDINEEETWVEIKVYLSSLPVFNGKILEVVDFMSLLHHITEHPVTYNKKNVENFEKDKNESNKKTNNTWFNYNFPRPQKVWRILASKACRNAIMVGKTLSVCEMIKIKKKLSVLKNPWNCPHGRPTIKYVINNIDIKNCFKNYYLKLYDEIANLILTKNYDAYKYLFHNHTFFLIMSTKPLLGPLLKFQ